MQRTTLAVGIACGAALGLGGAVAADVLTEPADAQGDSNFATKADLKRVENNSSAAQRSAKWVQNKFGVYMTPAGELISLSNPDEPILQDRGKGEIGLPASHIGSGAILREKIANEAVSSEKIAPGAVTTDRIADSARVRQVVARNSPAVVLTGATASEVIPPQVLPGAGAGFTWAMSATVEVTVAGGSSNYSCFFTDGAGTGIGGAASSEILAAAVGTSTSTLVASKEATDNRARVDLRCLKGAGAGTVTVNFATMNITAVPAA